jgi:16S rRNA processing protein RimM
VHDGFVYLTLEGCAAPEDVEKLRGLELYIDRAHAAPLPEGMFYLADLMGCRALDEEGRELGVLTEVLQHGPTDVWVFRTPGGGTMMAPNLPTVFVEKDVANNLIRVDASRLQEVAVYED